MATHAEVNDRVFDVWFGRTVLGAILVNPGVLAWSLLDHDHDDLIEAVHTGLLVLFTVEIAIKFIEAGCNLKRFVGDRWNVFDLMVTVLCWLPAIGGLLGTGVLGLRMLQLARFARIFHAMRHLSTLRLAHFLHH